jgi:hypothetical protein
VLQRRGIINVAFDEMRDAIERIPPAEYLTLSYYDRWLRAAEMLLADRWLLGPTTPRRFSGGNSSRRPEMPGQSLQREPSVRVRASPRLRPRAYGHIADGGGPNRVKTLSALMMTAGARNSASAAVPRSSGSPLRRRGRSRVLGDRPAVAPGQPSGHRTEAFPGRQPRLWTGGTEPRQRPSQPSHPS